MKYVFATTSVVALLMAGPTLAQAPAANPAAPAGNGPDIVVKQPPPVITVQPHAPNVTVVPEKPDVAVKEAPPKVTVTNPKPDVAVESGQPAVKVLPSGKPDVAVVKEPAGTAAAGVGTTTAPAAGAVAPVTPAVVFPVAKDVGNLIGKDVYGMNGDEVGEINNLLIGADGRVHAAIIEFGGFLGIGEHKVAVPWDRLNVTRDRVTINMTEAQIKAGPRWNKDRPGQFADYRPFK
jgi:sporulation protein YlmC with PRC-barrel domain